MIKNCYDRWVFQRQDGKFMRVQDSGGMERAMWSEWGRFEEATLFQFEDGYEGDHRWEGMLEGAVARRVICKFVARLVE